MRKPAQERSRRTLLRILDAATEAFAEDGVDGSAVSDIVKRARSSVGSFYGRFRGKDELVLAVDERLWAQVDERWRSEALDRGVGPGHATEQHATDALTPVSIDLGELSVRRDARSWIESTFYSLAPEAAARGAVTRYLSRHDTQSRETEVVGRMVDDLAGALRDLARPGVRAGLPAFLARVVVDTVQADPTHIEATELLVDVVQGTLMATVTDPLRSAQDTTSDLADQAASQPDRAARPTEPFDIWA